ncbi:chorismate synthase [Soehngenia saccharolytica]|nr:chorismate synthase [Soehngenia saccharolytica]
MIRFLTAGESHGDKLIGILEGIPSNLKINNGYIDYELSRRQKGYGRSDRMNIESDKVQIVSGLDEKVTTGAPISLVINNLAKGTNNDDYLQPRPGHADLAGLIKYNQLNAKNILERASARETAMRTAIGAICKIFLSEFGIKIFSHVISISDIESNIDYYKSGSEIDFSLADNSTLRMIDSDAEKIAKERIDFGYEEGFTLGGKVEIIIKNVPIGIGSHIQWDRRLDGKIAQSMMSIPGVKAVEIGLGETIKNYHGNLSNDEIFYSEDKGYYRKTNLAGGIEGGISNGEDIVVRITMKPIPTQQKPLKTVNIITKEETKAFAQRSDVCAVASLSIVAEAMAAISISEAFMEKFSGDSMEEVKRNFINYQNYTDKR